MNNQTTGHLLVCPDCQLKGNKSILGSVTITGDLIIMRYNRAFTIVRATQCMVVCTCGFGTVIDNKTNGVATYPSN